MTSAFRMSGAMIFFDPDIPFDYREVGVVGAVVQTGLLEHEVVEHRDLMACGKQVRHHGGSKIAGTTGHENVVRHWFLLVGWVSELKDELFHIFTKCMGQDNMDLLDRICRGARRNDAVIRLVSCPATVAAGKYDGWYLFLSTGIQRLEDISRLSGGGDTEKNIFFGHFPGNLTGKELFIPIIIADRGQDRTVYGECFGRERGTVFCQFVDELCRQVLGIRGRSPVSCDVKPASLLVTLGYCLHGFIENIELYMVLQQLLFGIDGYLKVILK